MLRQLQATLQWPQALMLQSPLAWPKFTWAWNLGCAPGSQTETGVNEVRDSVSAFVWPAASSTVPASAHLPLTLVLPKDQLRFEAARLDCGDIMILSHIRVIWHALLACLLLAGFSPQNQHSASASLLSNTSGDCSSVWFTLIYVCMCKPPQKSLSVLCVI